MKLPADWAWTGRLLASTGLFLALGATLGAVAASCSGCSAALPPAEVVRCQLSALSTLPENPEEITVGQVREIAEAMHLCKQVPSDAGAR